MSRVLRGSRSQIGYPGKFSVVGGIEDFIKNSRSHRAAVYEKMVSRLERTTYFDGEESGRVVQVGYVERLDKIVIHTDISGDTLFEEPRIAEPSTGCHTRRSQLFKLSVQVKFALLRRFLIPGGGSI